MRSVPTTGAEFLELVEKSGLVPPDRVQEGLRDLSPDLPPLNLAEEFLRRGILTRFQANQLLTGRYKGMIVGKYKILKLLGGGGMGRVYLAEHVFMGHKVAMKVLAIPNNSEDLHVTRFLMEARASATLNHPNIIRAHDIDRTPEGYYYLILEYVEGMTLNHVVARQGPLPSPRAANYAWQAARGLQHINEHNLVHRDIKPSNLLIDRQGTVKILDLGLARFLRGCPVPGSDRLDNGLILGTADYLSPEQGRNSHHVDIRADIYSLGGTLYFLLTGRPPFAGLSVAQKLISHQTAEPDPLGVHVPPGLAEVVRRMMAKAVEARYQTPGEVVAALLPWMAGDPTSSVDLLGAAAGLMWVTDPGVSSPTLTGKETGPQGAASTVTLAGAGKAAPLPAAQPQGQ